MPVLPAFIAAAASCAAPVPARWGRSLGAALLCGGACLPALAQPWTASAVGAAAPAAGLVQPWSDPLAPAGRTLAQCPQSEPHSLLSLTDVLARALCHHPATRQSWAAVQSSAAELQLQHLAARPTAEAQLALGHEARSDRLPGEPAERRSRGVGHAVLQAQWVLLDFGRRQADQQAAVYGLLAAQATHAEALHEVMLQTLQASLNLIELETSRTLARESERFTRDLLALALKPRGKPASPSSAIDRVDELQARSSLSRRVLDLRRADAQVSRARGQLAVLIGLPPSAMVAVVGPEHWAGDNDIAPQVTELMALAAERHPGLQAARARIGQAESALDLARRAERPVLRATAGLRQGRDVFNATLSERSAGVQLEIPLFGGAQRRAREQQAQAALDTARAGLRLAQQDRALQVWQAYQTVREEVAALRMAERWQQQAEDLLAVETQAFAVGDSDMFDVLDAHDEVMEARQSVVQSQTSLVLGRFQLSSAIGRLPWPDALNTR